MTDATWGLIIAAAMILAGLLGCGSASDDPANVVEKSER